MGKIPAVIIIITLVIVAVAAVSIINPGLVPGTQDQNITLLTPVEVRDYEGERLSSIADFHENSIRGPQYINQSAYMLEISGLVTRPISLSYDEILKGYPAYEKKVTLFCVEGWEVTILWKGVRVEDLLTSAGVNPAANTVIFYAADGYSTSLPIEYIKDRDILLAHSMNGVVLPAERGFPFQLVAEDRWGYKWIKWVTRIEVSDDPAYRGYWEERGYSQTGDLQKGFFG
ncbi:MAG: molybdopterin-dependent oxidoreductase [Methanoregulaceae archaeon]|jgi:DMSO/TMAO reductase YedYZ molybdopterin-dependent catalytic subunit|nr:molybdopterin-dependent oxidoreductase [Methanoregulaceae archaeon]MCU0629422.1 molybdopterin-dependent oxidoreductase [Methanoregulaceae archaeon]